MISLIKVTVGKKLQIEKIRQNLKTIKIFEGQEKEREREKKCISE